MPFFPLAWLQPVATEMRPGNLGKFAPAPDETGQVSQDAVDPRPECEARTRPFGRRGSTSGSVAVERRDRRVDQLGHAELACLTSRFNPPIWEMTPTKLLPDIARRWVSRDRADRPLSV